MAPENVKKAQKFTLVTPVVYSASANRKLAASLRRLGADDRTIAKLTGPRAAPASR